MKKEAAILLDTIKNAGNAIEEIRKKGVACTLKDNLSPLTEADLCANDILKQGLLSAFPQDGWLSEETVDDKSRLDSKRVWIVDPIDGTKEFIKNIPEYAISVALVENGVPILAAVYNPAKQDLFHAIKNQGAWFNGQIMKCDISDTTKLRLLASRTELQEGRWDHFKHETSIREVGSIAYKLALVAQGNAHATFSLTPKSEWDIAAGILLVEEAGGKVTDIHGRSFVLNQANIRVPGVIACHKKIYTTVYSLAQSVQFDSSL